LSSDTSGAINIPIFLTSNLKISPFIPNDNVRNIRTLETEYQITAGKYSPFVYDLVDDSTGFTVSNLQINKVDSSKFVIGSFILGSYRGIYEVMIRID
jgi:hypothetical protein